MPLKRKDFLKLVGTALVCGMIEPRKIVAAAPGPDQLAILYDPSKCVGCRACQMACKQWNKLPPETENAATLPAERPNQRLYDAPVNLSFHTWTLIKLSKTSQAAPHFFSYQCMHCVDAACVTVCPVGALYKDERGFTAYNRDKCIGCGYCTQFCPYHVPHLGNENILTGAAKSAKCTFCQDRIQNNLGGPSCAERCPVGALVWGRRGDLLANARQRVTALRAQGLGGAMLYGEHEAGGLHRLSILLGAPAEYALPANPIAPTVARIWKKGVQPLGQAAFAAALAGVAAIFLVARRHIHMERVE